MSKFLHDDDAATDNDNATTFSSKTVELKMTVNMKMAGFLPLTVSAFALC